MMPFEIIYLDEARKDLEELDGSQRIHVIKAVRKVAQNPLPQSEGGFGKPLGNMAGIDLAGLCKVKLKSDGIRVVYKVERTDRAMKIIVIGMRADEEVYRIAAARRERHGM